MGSHGQCCRKEVFKIDWMIEGREMYESQEKNPSERIQSGCSTVFCSVMLGEEKRKGSAEGRERGK